MHNDIVSESDIINDFIMPKTGLCNTLNYYNIKLTSGDVKNNIFNNKKIEYKSVK